MTEVVDDFAGVSEATAWFIVEGYLEAHDLDWNYKSDQTGAKTQSGGENHGLASDAYQPVIAGAVKTEPMAAAAKQAARQTASFFQSMRFTSSFRPRPRAL